jgi:hypothetical protein
MLPRVFPAARAREVTFGHRRHARAIVTAGGAGATADRSSQPDSWVLALVEAKTQRFYAEICSAGTRLARWASVLAPSLFAELDHGGSEGFRCLGRDEVPAIGHGHHLRVGYCLGDQLPLAGPAQRVQLAHQ